MNINIWKAEHFVIAYRKSPDKADGSLPLGLHESTENMSSVGNFKQCRQSCHKPACAKLIIP